jgi:hypothetical protein
LRLDADFRFDDGCRLVRFTPRGSACSAQFGGDTTPAALGWAHGHDLIVSDTALNMIRNQQVSGSSPLVGSIRSL